MRVGIQAAWIGGACLILTAIITGILTNSKKGSGHSATQKNKEQKVDSGAINNYNAGRDVKIENNTYNNVIPKDSLNRKKESKQKIENKINAPNALIATQNQSGGQNTVNYFQNEYRPLDESISKEVSLNLETLINKYPNHPFIHVEIESGNNYRNKVALALNDFFSEKKLGSYDPTNTFIGRFPDYPISVFTSLDNKKFATELIDALKPFIQGEYKLVEIGTGLSNYLRIYLNGQPVFDNNGRVKIN